MTQKYVDKINAAVRRDLRAKQHALADHTVFALDPASDEDTRNGARRAIRRIEKSLANLTAKLLCAHNVMYRSLRMNGFTKISAQCSKCKAHALIDQRYLKKGTTT